MRELVRTLDHYRLDILGITETHMPNSEQYILSECHLFFYSGGDDEKCREGVGIANAKRILGKSYLFHSIF